jgi:hypothetical protein
MPKTASGMYEKEMQPWRHVPLLCLSLLCLSVSSVCPFNPFKFSTADGQASRQTRLGMMVVVKI